jgi:hypothetical protein
MRLDPLYVPEMSHCVVLVKLQMEAKRRSIENIACIEAVLRNLPSGEDELLENRRDQCASIQGMFKGFQRGNATQKKFGKTHDNVINLVSAWDFGVVVSQEQCAPAAEE